MSKKVELLGSKFEVKIEHNNCLFEPITSEQETRLLSIGYRKISDENFSFVYNIENTTASESNINMSFEEGKKEVFYVKMQKSYIGQNFFNVNTEFEILFGSNNSHLTVFLGCVESGKKGRVDRKNQGNAARIHIGKDYKEWSKLNFKPLDYMRVEVLPDSTIRLTKKNE